MGISPIFVRWADVGPFTSAFWRVFLALPALYRWMRWSERDLDPVLAGKASFSRPIVLAGLAFTGDLLFWHVSIMTTSVANATFFATTAPIWVIAFGWLLFRQRVGAGVLIGLAFCLAGGAALLARSLQIHRAGAVGDLEGLATGVFFGLYFLAVQAARRRRLGRARHVRADRHHGGGALPRRRYRRALAVASQLGRRPGVAGHGLDQPCRRAGTARGRARRLPAAFSSLVIFLEAIGAAGFAFLLLGEPISLVQALGGLLILAGIFVARPK